MLFLFRSMSEKRTLLSRPRTRVYDCNYNIGEGYYKPMMDHLDRKYYGSSAASAKPINKSSLFGSSGATSAFDEYRSSSPVRSRRSGSDSRLSLPDDDFEQEVTLWKIHRAAILPVEAIGLGSSHCVRLRPFVWARVYFCSSVISGIFSEHFFFFFFNRVDSISL